MEDDRLRIPNILEQAVAFTEEKQQKQKDERHKKARVRKAKKKLKQMSDNEDLDPTTLKGYMKLTSENSARRHGRTSVFAEITDKALARLKEQNDRAAQKDDEELEAVKELCQLHFQSLQTNRAPLLTPQRTPGSTPSTPGSSVWPSDVKQAPVKPPVASIPFPPLDDAAVAPSSFLKRRVLDPIDELEPTTPAPFKRAKTSVATDAAAATETAAAAETVPYAMIGHFTGSPQLSWKSIPSDTVEGICKLVQVGDCAVGLSEDGVLRPVAFFSLGIIWDSVQPLDSTPFDIPGVIVAAKASTKRVVAQTAEGKLFTMEYKGKGEFGTPREESPALTSFAIVPLPEDPSADRLVGFGHDIKNKTPAKLTFFPSGGDDVEGKLAIARISADIACGNDRCLTVTFDGEGKGLAYHISTGKSDKKPRFSKVSKWRKNGDVLAVAANSKTTYVLDSTGTVHASDDGKNWETIKMELPMKAIVAGDNFAIGQHNDNTLVTLLESSAGAVTSNAHIEDFQASGDFVSFLGRADRGTAVAATPKKMPAAAVDTD
jgi:hypothetical protein